jgi:ATP:corrinoid adenosyltransferase
LRLWLISGAEIADFLRREKPPWIHPIQTGREAPAELICLADIAAEQGIEF